MQQFPVTGDSVGSWPFQMFILLDNSEDCHCRFSILVIPRTLFSIDLIVPPASGVVHQVNLEYLGRDVFKTNSLFYPDSFTTAPYSNFSPCILICPHAFVKGFAVPKEYQLKVAEFTFYGTPAQLRHGDAVIAAITRCTNNS